MFSKKKRTYKFFYYDNDWQIVPNIDEKKLTELQALKVKQILEKMGYKRVHFSKVREKRKGKK